MKKIAGITALVVAMVFMLSGVTDAQRFGIYPSDESVLTWTKGATTGSTYVSLANTGADTTQWIDHNGRIFPPCAYNEMPLMLLQVFATNNGAITDSIGVVVHSSPDMSSISISDTLKFELGAGLVSVLMCQDVAGPTGGETPMGVRYQRFVFVDIEASHYAYYNLSAWPVFYQSR